ncbi:antitoxin [Nocardioidaceae bacterium]|nr:antitoxin [Nocardioidaceae bacterium]
MGFLDDAKKRLSDAIDQHGDSVADAAEKHGDKVTDGIDKAAAFAKDKLSDRGDTVDKIAGKAKEGAETLTEKAKDLRR